MQPFAGIHGGFQLGSSAPEYAALSRQWLNLNFDESARGEDELPLGL